MDKKDFLKLFIPPIILKLKNWRRDHPALTASPLPQLDNKAERMLLIGNGPSLNESVSKYKEDILKCDRMATNSFASTPLYEEIKPNFYLFADPAFFDVPENQKETITKLFDALLNKTTWPLLMIVPSSAKNAPLLTQLNRNPKIKVICYFEGWQNVGRLSKFEAWDKNLIGPPAQNVLNVGLYLSLFWGYRETYLIGADSTFFEDLRVDQDTNELYTIDTHFYNNKEIYIDKKFYDSQKRGRSRSDWKLHELIYAHGRMFEYYEMLRQYADHKGLKVYNACEYSWINCFERKKLK